MACATCHVIVGKDFYNKLPEPSEEEDCLDNAADLTETYPCLYAVICRSRLGCQLKVTPDLDGIDVTCFDHDLECRLLFLEVRATSMWMVMCPNLTALIVLTNRHIKNAFQSP